VALVLDPPEADEVDALRRALGDPALGRIPAHLTLVPPVNVAADDFDSAIERLRVAAGRQPGPLRLALGPPTSFLPANPVLYLPVGGELGSLRRLRDEVFGPPLERKLSWPWVPHVTLADGIDQERLSSAETTLDRYSAVAVFDRVVLLEEQGGRIWTEVADAALERRTVVGTGGLPLLISRGRVVDPFAAALLYQAEVAPPLAGRERWPPPGPPFYPVVVTARREDETVGVAVADARGQTSVVVRADVRGQGIGRFLIRDLEAVTRTRPPRTGPAS
jgi:2'-5' RNA ligase